MKEPHPPQLPLGLPAGSIRAALSLLIISVVIVEIIRGHELAVGIKETLLLVLALYFSTRRVVSVSPEVLARLEGEGHVPRERHPLFLPRFTIRFLMLLSFIAAGVYLYREGRLASLESLSSLGLVGGYLAGVVLRPMGRLLRRKEIAASLLDRFGDLRALLALGAVATLAVFYWLDRPDKLPEWAHHTTLTLVLFYFGAR